VYCGILILCVCRANQPLRPLLGTVVALKKPPLVFML